MPLIGLTPIAEASIALLPATGKYFMFLDSDQSDYLYKVDSAGVITSATNAFTNPMTTLGDVIYGVGGGVGIRLGIGTAGQVLTVAAGIPSWATPSAGTVTSVSGTASRVTSTGGATPVIDISASYVGQTSITTLGTIGTGTWNATAISKSKGGTGVDISSSALVLGTSSANAGKLTFANATNSFTQSFQGTVLAADITYNLPTTAPTAGQVLSSTAPSAGVATLSWATPTAGTVTSVGFTGGLITVANPTTTPALTVAGTSGGIPYFSSGTTWATSAALAANSLVIGGGAGVAPSTTTTGTGVLTALGINTGGVGAFVTLGGVLGTPSSGTATNLIGLPEGGLSLTDITTANTSTSAHGFFPKLTSNSLYYVNNAGALTALTVGAAGTVLSGNGVTSAPTWAAASSGITIGSTAITSGADYRILFQDATASDFVTQTANFTMGSVASGYLDVPTGYAITGFNFAKQKYSVGVEEQLAVGYLAGVNMSSVFFNIGGSTFLGIEAGRYMNGMYTYWNTIIGYKAFSNASTSGTDNGENVVVGYKAAAGWAGGCNYNVMVGSNVGSSAASLIRYSTYVGSNVASGASYASSGAFGYMATPTAANQLVFGATGAASGNGVFDNVYFNGVTHTSAAPVIINSCSGSGTNNAGASLTFATRSTGNATPPNIIFKTGATLGSGTTLQTATTRFTIGELRLTADVPIKLKGYTVATLPAAPSVGDTAYCTDLLAPTFFTVAVGGGAVTGIVFYNGSSWIT